MFIKIKDQSLFADHLVGLGLDQDDLDFLNMPRPANDSPFRWTHRDKLPDWLCRLAQPGLSFESLTLPLNRQDKTAAGSPLDDWQTIANICGYSSKDFMSAGASLPLTAAEVDYFRRNHSGTENHISRDFLAARTDLPSPLAELYGLYLHRCRVDTEAALFVAQSTGSTRVARVMSDLLAIGAFANGVEYISYLGITYSVPAAFDTSDLIDQASHKAAQRLALPVNHPGHLLKLTPDEISVLASCLVEKQAMAAPDFLEKANLLAEARQDVTRLPIDKHLVTAIVERDLPVKQLWVTRLCAAYARIFESWIAGLPEFEAILSGSTHRA